MPLSHMRTALASLSRAMDAYADGHLIQTRYHLTKVIEAAQQTKEQISAVIQQQESSKPKGNLSGHAHGSLKKLISKGILKEGKEE